MRYSLVFVFAIAMGLSSCLAPEKSEHEGQTGKQEKVDLEKLKAEKLAEIKSLEKEVWNNLDVEEKKQRQLLVAYKDFSRNYHDDPNTPNFLFEAGRLSLTMGKPRSAIQLFTDVLDGFPKYNRKIEAAYLVGLIYDTNLNDRTMASKAYAKVIEGYPESEWAETAQIMIDQLYMTDEQLIEMLKEKSQNQEQTETP